MGHLKARTAARIKAQYVLKNRLAAELQANGSAECFATPQVVDRGLERAEQSHLLTERSLQCSRPQFAERMIDAVAKGKKQEFGICKLLGAGSWIDDLHPVAQLSKLGPGEWFAVEGDFTLVCYAALLKQWQVCLALIKGGADPCVRACAPDGNPRVKAYLRQLPGSFAVWVVRVLVNARRAGAEALLAGNESECAVCGERSKGMLCWGAPCHHMLCEKCFWMDILSNHERDELVCPVCLSSVPGVPATVNEIVLNASASRAAWEALPLEVSAELLRENSRSKKRRFEVHHSLRLAHSTSLGLTRGSRQEHFDNAIARADLARVHVLIGAGVNVDATNEYGQTALYISAWRGFKSIVNLLLEAGADPAICATCGSTPLDAAVLSGHTEVADVLSKFGCTFGSESCCGSIRQDCASSNSSLTRLIPADADHSGAGSVTIDRLAQPAVDTLLTLWNSLPSVRGREGATCSANRSYFCDIGGHICHALASLVERSGFGDSECVVLPHMRFLHYDSPGSSLAPHIDLSRTDVNGQRSTHTFLLYLTTCNTGGETALLHSVNQEENDCVLAVVRPRAGRLLVFPHVCPHEGRLVVDVPKVLVRGELYFRDAF